jgi:rhodanese-related sulfurtransferase
MPDMVDSASPKQTWDALLADPAAQLIDVRTDLEWQTVGVPDLAAAGKQPLLLSWQFPTGQVNPAFIEALNASNLAPGQPLYFLCRSGVRSLAAAQAAAAAGYTACINVEEGFEGPPDRTGRRGTLSGWQADGLPWGHVAPPHRA